MPGYRGQSFEQRAKALQANDYSATKDFFVAVGQAIDRLEAEPVTPPPTNADDTQTNNDSN